MENAASPPPFNPPPPPQAPAAPPPRKRSRVWLVLGVMLVVLLLFVVAGGAKFLLHGLGVSSHSAHLNGRYYEEHVIEEKDSGDRIAVVEVQGIISSFMMDGSGVNMVTSIKDQLKLAAKDDSVKAVLLKVDSPGGEVLASDEIYRALQQFHKDSKKPVIASMGSLAASGGYYVSAPCQWIVANELTITGSIGVIMHGYNYRGLMDKIGVRPMTFKSGRFKDMMSGDRSPEDIPAEEGLMLKGLIDETFNKFKSVVAEGRGQAAKGGSGQRKLADDWSNYADGRILSGKQAHELGMVDELGDFDAAVKRAEKLAGISEASLIRYQMPFDLMNMFKLFGKTEAARVKVDFGIELPKIQAGRLYFLSPFVWQ